MSEAGAEVDESQQLVDLLYLVVHEEPDRRVGTMGAIGVLHLCSPALWSPLQDAILGYSRSR